jgi:CheY-like chemotaxis protein
VRDGEEPSAASREAPSGPLPARRRVLVVEDDPDTRAVLVEALTEEPDLVAEGADDGQSALERLRRPPGVDLVLCDLAMPGLDGFGLAARLREDAATAGLPVVAMTALDDAVVAARATGAAYDAVVAKPFDLAELAAVLRAVLLADPAARARARLR